MNFDRIVEIANKNSDNLVKEVELSTGDVIKVKQTLPVNDMRVMALIIASTGFKELKNDEIIHRFDSLLSKTTEIHTFIRFMTDIDVEGVDLDDLTEKLVEADILDEIYDSFNEELVEKIIGLARSYIQEEKRAQEIEGQLGYRLEILLEEMDAQTKESLTSFEKLIENEELVNKLSQKMKIEGGE